MKFENKTMIQIAETFALLLMVTVGAAVPDQQASAADCGAVLPKQAVGAPMAGISSALNPNTISQAGLSSGVSNIMFDFSVPNVKGVEVYSVREGLEADDYIDYTEEDLIEDDSDLPEADEELVETSFCGFTNLGIAKVSKANLNVREKPTTDSAVVGKMTRHNACEIIGVEGEWTQIVSGNVKGYVMSKYLLTGAKAFAVAKEEVTTYATVNTTTLRVREEPSTESDIIILVGNGEDLVVLEEVGEWYKIEIDDEEGYVYGKYVTLSQKLQTAMTIKEIKKDSGVSSTRMELVDFALQYVGNKYVWGGTSLTKGVDCSGYTMKVYAKFGVTLPHSSKAQPSYGTKIEASEAQPGDLFFYGKGKTISHVAIYIGNGQIVHASNKRDGIKISNCNYRKPICVVSYLD